jgi:hypothetical protein
MQYNQVLTEDQLRRQAPSVFATKPDYKVSDQYTFLPTYKVVDGLRAEGWLPVFAQEQNVRLERRQGFAKHMLRFTRQEFIDKQMTVVGQLRPEVILVNSHDRTKAYQLHAGVFRLACLNGMVVADSEFGRISVRHIGLSTSSVIRASMKVLEGIPTILHKVEEFQARQLTADERVALATGAHAMRWEDESRAPVKATQLLQPRRYGDDKTDLWTTFNVVQENLIKGGLRDRNRRDPHTHRAFGRVRAVRGIDEDMKLNKGLWQLAEMVRDGSIFNN